MRLFREVVDPGGTAVIWNDDPWSPAAEREAKQRGLRIMTVGETGEALRLGARAPTLPGQSITIAAGRACQPVTQIGSAARGGRVGQYVQITGGDGQLKKTQKQKTIT